VNEKCQAIGKAYFFHKDKLEARKEYLMATNILYKALSYIA
jgi:hypothetical protein